MDLYIVTQNPVDLPPPRLLHSVHCLYLFCSRSIAPLQVEGRLVRSTIPSSKWWAGEGDDTFLTRLPAQQTPRARSCPPAIRMPPSVPPPASPGPTQSVQVRCISQSPTTSWCLSRDHGIPFTFIKYGPPVHGIPVGKKGSLSISLS